MNLAGLRGEEREGQSLSQKGVVSGVWKKDWSLNSGGYDPQEPFSSPGCSQSRDAFPPFVWLAFTNEAIKSRRSYLSKAM